MRLFEMKMPVAWQRGCLFLLLMLSVVGQQTMAQARIDSLKVAINVLGLSTQKVDAINELAKYYTGRNNELAEKYLATVKEQIDELNYPKGLAYYYVNKGTLSYYKSNYVAAERYHRLALSLFEEIGDKQGIAKSYSNIGLSLFGRSEYDSAISSYTRGLLIRKQEGIQNDLADSYTLIGRSLFKKGAYKAALDSIYQALKIRESIDDKSGIALSLNYLGDIYKIQGLYDEAIENYSKAYDNYKEINNPFGLAVAGSNIAGVYLAENNYAKAKPLLEEALEKFTDAGNPFYISQSLNSLGNVLESEGESQWNNALANYQKAYQVASEKGSKNVVVTALNNMAYLRYKQGGLADAKSFLLQARKVGEEVGEREELMRSVSLLATINKASGNYKQALQYQEEFIALEDTISKLEIKREIGLIEQELLAERKEREILEIKKDSEILEAKVEQQRIIQWAFVIGILGMIVFSAILYNRFKVTQTQKKVIEKERNRSDELLLNILPLKVANELKVNGKSLARHYAQASVMFADIKNFTKVAEKLSPEELVAEIDFHFKAFDGIIGKYNVEKIKTIGDAYMCASGLPEPDAKNAVNIVLAALDIQAFMEQTRKEREAKNIPFFEIRIGIHTGPLVAGIVGMKKFAYDIWGDTVNIAARMESAGETGKVNISQSTYLLIQDNDLLCEYRGKIGVKNKGELDMYFVKNKAA